MPTNLAQAAEPLEEVRRNRQRRPIIRPVSQVSCSLSGNDLKDVWSAALDETLRWLSNKASGQLPQEAWDGQSFELERIGTQPTAAVRLSPTPDIDYWAARNEAADENIPNRSWVTEIGLARKDDELKFGARLTCVTRGRDTHFYPSIPRIVRQLAENVGLLDHGQPLLSVPINVDDETAALALVDLLRDQRRTRQVFVISRHETGHLVNANYLAGQTCGASHVAVISPKASYALTDILGREYSVYRGAVRTYQPDFDPDENQPTDHPVCRPETIVK